MIKVVATVRRKPGMTHRQYTSYIWNVHAALARENPVRIQRYIQNHVFDGAYGSPDDTSYRLVFHRDSVTELFFEDLQALKQTFSHPHVIQKVGPDGVNFGDLSTSLSLIMTEEPLPASGQGEAQLKVIAFLSLDERLAAAERMEAVRAAHDSAFKSTPAFAAGTVRCALSWPVVDDEGVLAYFGGTPTQPVNCMISYWVSADDHLDQFDSYWQSLTRHRHNHERLANESESFFLFAKEKRAI